MEKKLLIVGIDPGTTLGYAILDIDGNLLELKSSKQLSFSQLISKTIEKGKILAVGCDKKNVPNFVKNFAIKNGAKLIHPKTDLSIKEKKEITSTFNPEDDHQRDALASALFAFKEVSPLLKKINSFIKKYKKEKIQNELKELVILKEKSINDALSLLEKPLKIEEKIIEKIEEEKPFKKNDFLILYNKLKKKEKEIKILKNYNNNLTSQIKNLKEKYKYLSKKITQLRLIEQPQELLEFKEKRIQNFAQEISLKEEQINKLQKEITWLFSILSSLNKNYLLKKMNNLGHKEFERLNPLLDIQKDDILLIEDPNIISEKTISFLKNKVNIILYKKTISKKIKELPFIFIDIKKFKIEENKYFAIVNKKELDKIRDKSDLLDKILKDYKKERQE